MISDIGSFLDWFGGVHRRTVRDVSILPVEAETWAPATGTNEEAWGVPKIVQHIAEARSFFANGFMGRGWVWEEWPEELHAKDGWVPALEGSLERFRADVGSASPDRLTARIQQIDTPDRTVSGWRALMMMAEHEVAHRSQIGAYAGLNGWPVAQIFGKTNEWVIDQAEEQRRRRTH